MPRIPIYNAGSEIWQAYLSGLEARRAEEQDKLKKETDARDFEEKKTQFEKQHNLAIKEAEANERARQYQEKINLEKYKIDVNKAMLAGEIPIPGKVTRPEWASINAPETFVPEDFVNETLGIRIPANQLPNRDTYIKTQRELDLAKGAGELERAKEVAKFSAETKAAAEAAAMERLRELEKGRNERNLDDNQALLDRTLAAIGARGSNTERKDNAAVVGIAQKVKSDPMYKKWQGTVDAYNYVTKAVPDPTAPGVNDMRLVYMWVKGLDESVVRPSEYETLIKVGVPWLAAKKLAIKRLTNNTILLPPETRQAIINDLKYVHAMRGQEWNKLLGSARAQAKYVDPSVDDNKFNELIYGGAYEEEGTPVTLKPKGGKK